MSVAYLPKSCINNYHRGVRVFFKLNIKALMHKTEGMEKLLIILFETYKTTVIPYGKHMFQTESDMVMSTICAYLSSKYALPHCKCVLSCFAQCPRIDLPSQESYQHNSNVSLIRHFHVYQHISRCNVHNRRPFNKNRQFQFFEASTYSIVTAKIYKRE